MQRDTPRFVAYCGQVASGNITFVAMNLTACIVMKIVINAPGNNNVMIIGWLTAHMGLEPPLPILAMTQKLLMLVMHMDDHLSVSSTGW